MKKFSKKVLALICSLSLILSVLSGALTNIVSAQTTETYAKYTFDEADTEYWLSVDPSNGGWEIASGGNSGNALTTAFSSYDTSLVTFDFVLKNNSTYFISYQFKTDSYETTIKATESKIVCAEDENKSNKVTLASFDGDVAGEWPNNMENWNTRTAIIKTGADTVSGERNKIGFYLAFSDVAHRFYIDNVKIYEINPQSTFTADFEDGTTENIVNLTDKTMSVVDDPFEGEQGKVLKLDKATGKSFNYKLMLPAELDSSAIYTLSYKYRSDAPSKVDMTQDTNFYYVSNDSLDHGKLADRDKNLNKSLRYFILDSEGGWPKLNVGSWKTDSFEFTPTAADLANGYKYITLKIDSFATQPDGDYSIYLDDISLSLERVYTDASWDFSDKSKPINYILSTGEDTYTPKQVRYTDSSGCLLYSSKTLNQKVTIFLDYTLEPNTKYVVALDFKANSANKQWRGKVNGVYAAKSGEMVSGTTHLLSTITNGGGNNFNQLYDWNHSVMVIETGDKVDENYNQLALYVHDMDWGENMSVNFDNIEVQKLDGKTTATFDDGTTDDIMNVNYATSVTVANGALKLSGYSSKTANYGLLIPYEMVADKDYTLSYSYRSTADITLANNSNIYYAPSVAPDIGNENCYTHDYGELHVAQNNTKQTDYLPLLSAFDSMTLTASEAFTNASIQFRPDATAIAAGKKYAIIHLRLPKGTANYSVYFDNISLAPSEGESGPASMFDYSYSKYNFDEADTDYWSYQYTPNGTNTAKTPAITANGNTGNSLTTSFGTNDKLLYTFDYELKNNTKYYMTFKFKTSSWQDNFSHTNSQIVCAEADNMSNKTNFAVIHTYNAWLNNMEKYSTRKLVFETGDSTVTDVKNKLGLYFEFGNAGTLYIDDITISELKDTTADYNAGFENGNVQSIINTTNSDISVATDPKGTQGNVLKLEKAANAAGSHMLLLPTKLEAGNVYTVKYKFLADSNVVVGGTSDTAFYYVNESELQSGNKDFHNKNLKKRFYHFTREDVDANGTKWPKLDFGEWISKEFTFTPSADNIANGYTYIALRLGTYANDTEDHTIYLDDIIITKKPGVTVTLDANGGTLENTAVTAPARQFAIFPTPSKENYIFTGWYKDAALTKAADNVMPGSNTTYYAKYYMENDVDNNGLIDEAAELVALANSLLSDIDSYSETFSDNAADANKDGVIDIRDLIRLKKIFAGISSSSIPEGYGLVWADNFDGNAVDLGKWSKSEGHTIDTTTTASLEDKISVSNGNATFSMSYDADEAQPIRGPKSLATYDTMNFKYGYLEVRAKLPYGQNGPWGAIWLNNDGANLEKNSNNYLTPTYKPEIDIAEIMDDGNYFASQLHLWSDTTTDRTNILGTVSSGENYHHFDSTAQANEWHTYGLKWTADSIIFYIDGKINYTYTIPASDKAAYSAYMPIILSLQYTSDGTLFANNPDAEVNMEVDYVRLYQNSEGSIINKRTADWSTLNGTISDTTIAPVALYSDERTATLSSYGDVVTNGSLNYLFITDLHEGSNTAAVLRQLTEMVSIIDTLNADDNTANDIDFVAVGGDLTTGMYATTDDMKAALQRILAPLNECSVPVMIVRGNHDDNSYYYMYADNNNFKNKFVTDYERQTYLDTHTMDNAGFKTFVLDNFANDNNKSGKKISSRVHDSRNPNSAYYYYDFPEKKNRVICLDSVDVEKITAASNGATFWGYGLKQLYWLIDEALKAPADYNYTFISHMGYETAIGLKNGAVLNGIINAFQNKTAYDSGKTIVIDGKTVALACDYTSRTGGDILAFQFGHEHKDRSLLDETNNMANLTISSAGQYGSSSDNIGGQPATILDRTFNTITEACFDIVSVGTEAVYEIRFGAGSDTTITLK